jgi:hypothetical protein
MWSVALAACFDPHAPADVPCAPLGSPARCPSGQICVPRGGIEVCALEPGHDAGAIDARDACVGCPDTPPGDSDGDGVLDAVDNCPGKPNSDQADEDNDLIGDVCDPCPPYPTNTDGDGDGVGDACDPNPGTGGDAILSFDGFAGGLPAGWTTAGSFTAAGGDGVAVAAANAGATLSTAIPSAARYDVWAEATLDSITTALGAFGVAAVHQPGTDAVVVCQLVGNANGTSQELRIFDTNAGTLVANVAHAFTPGLRALVRIHRDGTKFDCYASNPAAMITGTSAFAPASPEIELRVRSASAHYHWVMVTTSP